MTIKQANIPLFTTPTKSVKTIGIIKNNINNQKVIPDPTTSVDRQLSTTVLKRVSFYIPENRCHDISTKVNNYPKDKYINSLPKNESQSTESNSLGSKLGSKIDGVIKMGCKLTNKLDNVIRTNNKHDKFETPRFEIKVDAPKSDINTFDSAKSSDKKKSTPANKVIDFGKNYALKWDSKVAKMYTPVRNSEDNIVLNSYKVYSNEDGSKKSILHSLKYTSHNPDDCDIESIVKDRWLWDIISNKRISDNETSDRVCFGMKQDDLLDGFDIFCQQMAQGAGANLINTLTNVSSEDMQNTEFIRDYKGSGSDLLQQGKSLYVLPPTIANTTDDDEAGSLDHRGNYDYFGDYSDIRELFMPIGKGIWRWANSAVPTKETKCRSTQTEEGVESIILDTSLGPGFEFIYSTNTNEIYQLVFRHDAVVNDMAQSVVRDCEIYNLMSTTSIGDGI